MIKVLEKAIEKIRGLPPARQEYAASVLEQIAAAGEGVYSLSDDERAAVREGLADLDAGRIVSDADMTAFWNRRDT
jgi:predicted transcriptional regulator